MLDVAPLVGGAVSIVLRAAQIFINGLLMSNFRKGSNMAKKNKEPEKEEMIEKKSLIAAIIESGSSELDEAELESMSVDELKLIQVKPTPDVKRKTKDVFPSVGVEDTAVYPFTVPMPDEMDFEKYATLKRKDFCHDHDYFEHRALEAEFKVIKFRALAEEAKSLGSAQDRAKAKKLIKYAAKMKELQAALTAGGFDVNALLANAGINDDDGDE